MWLTLPSRDNPTLLMRSLLGKRAQQIGANKRLIDGDDGHDVRGCLLQTGHDTGQRTRGGDGIRHDDDRAGRR